MDRRTFFKASGATGAGLLLPMGGLLTSRAAAGPRVGKVMARDMKVPWGIAFLPNGAALVGERDTGRIYRIRRRGGKKYVGRLDVHSQKASWGEGGLLGLAVGPGFRRSRWLYAYISTRRDNRIIRVKYRRDGKLGRRRVVLKGIPTSVHHNGGRLVFGPGGLLYASTGDAEHPARAQNKKSKAGKILRMKPGGGVPRGNPFGNHVFSYGHRNVEGLTFDDKGRLWASEFGDKRRDELNRIRKGRNYGWPRVEGGDGKGGYRDPLAVWRPEYCSPSGVAVAHGWAWLGALRGRALMSVRVGGSNGGRKRRHFHNRFGRIRTVQKAPDGSLWITTSNHDGRPSSPHRNDDRIIRIGF